MLTGFAPPPAPTCCCGGLDRLLCAGSVLTIGYIAVGIGTDLNGGQRMSPDDSEDPLSKISQQLLDGFPENEVLTVTSPASRFVATSVILCSHFSSRNIITSKFEMCLISPIRTGLSLPEDLQSFGIIVEVVCDLNSVWILPMSVICQNKHYRPFFTKHR